MKYIIDTSQPFEGFVYSPMSDNVHTDYGRQTIDDLKKEYPNRSFAIIDDEELDELLDAYIVRISTEAFEEISKERYWELMECVPPAKQGRNWFYVGEAYNYDVHLFCYTDSVRYICAHRRLSKAKEAVKEAGLFLTNSVQK